MACETCDSDAGTVYTLHARIADTDVTIDMSFCSTACLRAWVGEDSGDGASEGPSATAVSPGWAGPEAQD